MPASLAEADRMCETLRKAAVVVNEDALAVPNVDDTALGNGVGHGRRMMFLDATRTRADAAAPLNDPPPVDLLFEIHEDTPETQLTCWAAAVRDYEIVWSLTTETAMRMPAPANAFTDAVVRASQAAEPDFLRMRVETSLHETVSNALVHGNLELPSLSELEGDDQGDVYERAVQAALADPALARRRMSLKARIAGDTLRIAVRDEGAGLPESNWSGALADGRDTLTSSDKSGRGLYLTAMFCDDMQRSADGRTVELTFTTTKVDPD
jgi:anti-sigma regulatory factor (Ser/Thr protein kinase)